MRTRRWYGLAMLLAGAAVIGCGRADVGLPPRDTAGDQATAPMEGYSASPPPSAQPEAASPPSTGAARPDAVASPSRPVGVPPSGDKAAPGAERDPGNVSDGQGPGRGGDRFDHNPETGFVSVRSQPLSTFSIDVDTASYAKSRLYLLQHRNLPPPDAVRIEEFINYFEYDYAGPTDEHPFAVHVESAACPWTPAHRLVRVGLQGRRIENGRPSTNLVFLLDVSGSMDQPAKLPLVKRSLHMMLERLGENDRVAIVVYAGAAGLVLPSTTADHRREIITAMDRLHAGGSTNGGEGIHLAYQVALDNYIQGGVNRVILCTDGDFNVGTTSHGQLVRLAEERARTGLQLTVLGFGSGNHNDALLEQLSNKANGNYAFIDTQSEAHKVLVEQLSGTLVTIAKDVKIQVEFNPRHVSGYRLIGYENRRLADRDFNDDAKDAGEIGAGHQVTAIYEIQPTGAAAVAADVDPLRFQQPTDTTPAANSAEVMYVKLRYKHPQADKSTLVSLPVRWDDRRFEDASPDFQFASSVAAFGMLLRKSAYSGNATYADVWRIAAQSSGQDPYGYRGELLEMIRQAGLLVDPNSMSEAARETWQQPRVANPTPVQPVTMLPRSRRPKSLSLSRQPAFWIGLGAGGLITFAAVAVCLRVLLVHPSSGSHAAEGDLLRKPPKLQ